MTEVSKPGRKRLPEEEKTISVTFYTPAMHVKRAGGMDKARLKAKKLFEESTQSQTRKSK